MSKCRYPSSERFEQRIVGSPDDLISSHIVTRNGIADRMVCVHAATFDHTPTTASRFYLVPHFEKIKLDPSRFRRISPHTRSACVGESD